MLGTRAAEVRQDRSEGIAEVFLYEGTMKNINIHTTSQSGSKTSEGITYTIATNTNMKLYVSHPTQEQRILKLATERGEDGFYVYELIAPSNRGGLGIAQYNARIWGLRKKGYNIVNKKPGYFVYEN